LQPAEDHRSHVRVCYQGIDDSGDVVELDGHPLQIFFPPIAGWSDDALVYKIELSVQVGAMTDSPSKSISWEIRQWSMKGSCLSAGPAALKQAAMRLLMCRVLEWRLSITTIQVVVLSLRLCLM
jgi:hypothetical protein